MKYNFSEILADETKLGKKISQGDYLVDGQFPIIDQGQKKLRDIVMKQMACSEMFRQLYLVTIRVC